MFHIHFTTTYRYGKSITYDEIGNPTYYYNNLSLDWENGRQLTGGGTGTAGGSFSYDYNDAGLRVRKSSGFGTIDFYYNGDQLLSQVNGNVQMDFFYDSYGDLLGFDLNGVKYYYVFNMTRDIIGILDSDGNQVVSYVYDSWGKLISTSGSLADTIGSQNPFRYRGYYYDRETGFYYLQSRYYDPEIGRFLNADDISIPSVSIRSIACKNLYSYCENNPIICVDESGEFAHLLFAAAVGAVVSAASQVIGNAMSGNSLLDGIGMAIVTGGASGFLSATGLGVIGQAVGNGVIGLIGSVGSQIKEGNGISLARTARETLFSAASGAIGGKGNGNIYYEKNFIKRVVRSKGKEFGKAAKYYTSQTKKNVIKGTLKTKGLVKSSVSSLATSYANNILNNQYNPPYKSTVIAGGSGGLAPNKTWCYPGIYI